MSEKSALQKAMDEARERHPAYREISEIDEAAERFADRLAATLKRMRQEQNLGTADLARRLHVSQPTVSGVEKRGGNVRARTFGRYAKALGADLEVLADAIEQGFRAALSHEEDRARIRKQLDAMAALSASELQDIGSKVMRDITEALDERNASDRADAREGASEAAQRAASEPSS